MQIGTGIFTQATESVMLYLADYITFILSADDFLIIIDSFCCGTEKDIIQKC